jgi:hypothetical protein
MSIQGQAHRHLLTPDNIEIFLLIFFDIFLDKFSSPVYKEVSHEGSSPGDGERKVAFFIPADSPWIRKRKRLQSLMARAAALEPSSSSV